MPKYKLKKFKIKEADIPHTTETAVYDDDDDDDEWTDGGDDNADDDDDDDDAPEEVSFSSSRKTTMETAQTLREKLRDMEDRKKEKRKIIQERYSQQKLEKKQKNPPVPLEDPSERQKVSKKIQSLPAKVTLSDGAEDDDDDYDDDDDGEEEQDNVDDDDGGMSEDGNQPGEGHREFSFDENFIPLTRGIKVVPLNQKTDPTTTNPALNFRLQRLYGGRLKRDSAKAFFQKKTQRVRCRNVQRAAGRGRKMLRNAMKDGRMAKNATKHR
ncbi:uncharacterized protein LOC115224462 [Argonauta hians]